jgi:hypothetical protein
MYHQDDLRSLAQYLKTRSRELTKESQELIKGKSIPQAATTTNAPAMDVEAAALEAAAKQLQAIGYSPLLLETILEEYDVPYSILEVPLDDLPLHINDPDPLAKAICRWRMDTAT